MLYRLISSRSTWRLKAPDFPKVEDTDSEPVWQAPASFQTSYSLLSFHNIVLDFWTAYHDTIKYLLLYNYHLNARSLGFVNISESIIGHLYKSIIAGQAEINQTQCTESRNGTTNTARAYECISSSFKGPGFPQVLRPGLRSRWYDFREDGCRV